MASSVPQSEAYLEATTSRVLRFWWAWTWRWLLLMTGCLVAIAMPLNVFLGLFGTSDSFLLGFLEGVVFGCLSQVAALWHVLDKDFSDFRVRLEPALSEDGGSQFVAPAVKHALRVWWAWFWRAQLISIPGGFVTGLVVGVVGTILRMPPAGIQLTAAVSGLALTILVSVWMFGYAIREDYGSFRLRFLP